MLNEQPFFLKLDLQTFASEDTHPFADPEPVQSEPHPFAEAPEDSSFSRFTDQPNPLLEAEPAPETPQIQTYEEYVQGETANGQQQPEQPPQGEQEEYLDFSGRKVKAYDEDVKGLHTDYTELNRTYQQTNQQLQQAQQKIEQYQQTLQTQQAQPQLQQPPQQQGISPERKQQLNEEYMERMYEDKLAADKWWAEQPEIQELERQRMAELVNQQVQEIVGPIQQERQYLEQVNTARSKYPDFDQHTATMQQLVAQQPHLAEIPDSIEILYTMAKGLNAAPAPSLEQMLQDPAQQEKIIQNEQIRNMVLQKYAGQKQQINQSTPQVMSGSNRSQVPSSLGDRRPRTLSEASEAASKHFGFN